MNGTVSGTNKARAGRLDAAHTRCADQWLRPRSHTQARKSEAQGRCEGCSLVGCPAFYKTQVLAKHKGSGCMAIGQDDRPKNMMDSVAQGLLGGGCFILERQRGVRRRQSQHRTRKQRKAREGPENRAECSKRTRPQSAVSK